MALLYERYGRKLYNYGLANWQLNEDEAWELVYQTLYKIVETINRYQFEDEARFGAFVFKIFINYLRNHYRDTRRMQEHIHFVHFHETQFEEYEQDGQVSREVKKRIVEQSVKADDAAEGPNEESIPIALLKAELKQLEDWQRMLLLMRSQNMPYSEISVHVNKPETQLKVYYQRLKDRIMKKLSPKLQLIEKPR